MWRQEKEKNDAEIIKRKYAKHPSYIKISQIIFLLPGLQQDPRDQESGKNKKQVNTCPAEFKKREKIEIVI